MLVRYLHPAQRVAETIINISSNDRLNGLLVIKKEEKVVNRKKAQCIVFRHEKFEGHEIYAVARWVKVTKEGPAANFFDPVPTTNTIDSTTAATETAASTETNQNSSNTTNDTTMDSISSSIELPSGYTNFSNNTEDINMVRALGLNVDDDNEPVAENVPDGASDNVVTSSLNEGQEWGWEGFDHRKVQGISNVRAKLNGLSGNALQGMSFVGMFLLFLGHDLVDMIIEETNKNIEGAPMDLGEFIRFIGIQLFMSTMSGFNQKDYWSMRLPEVESGAPYRFHKWMSRKRF